MKDDTTIFGDRETVELLAEQPELLAIADAVSATQRKEARARRRHPRLLMAAAAIAGLAAAGAFLLTGLSGGHPTSAAGGSRTDDRLHNLPGVLVGHSGRVLRADCRIRDCGGFTYGPMPDLLDYSITRRDGAISSIDVTVFGTVVDSTAHVRVFMQGIDSSGAGRAVFSTRVSLNSTPSPPRWGAVSAWSGTLSPSDWDGACQDAVYWLQVNEPNGGGTPGHRGITEIQAPAFGPASTKRRRLGAWSGLRDVQGVRAASPTPPSEPAPSGRRRDHRGFGRREPRTRLR